MSLLAELETVLEAERDLLRAGQLSALAALVARKESVIAALSQRPEGSRSRLTSLMARAKANQTLLDAAQKGVQAAELRLRAIREVDRGLTAYTADGRSVCHSTAPRAVERRA